MTRAERIRASLGESFAPVALEVIDETHMHSVPPGSESHFKVVVVSERFAGQSRVARHRAVNEALAGEIEAGLHALSVQAYSPEEWAARGGVIPESPPCLGGSKHD